MGRFLVHRLPNLLRNLFPGPKPPNSDIFSGFFNLIKKTSVLVIVWGGPPIGELRTSFSTAVNGTTTRVGIRVDHGHRGDLSVEAWSTLSDVVCREESEFKRTNGPDSPEPYF